MINRNAASSKWYLPRRACRADACVAILSTEILLIDENQFHAYARKPRSACESMKLTRSQLNLTAIEIKNAEQRFHARDTASADFPESIEGDEVRQTAIIALVRHFREKHKYRKS